MKMNMKMNMIEKMFDSVGVMLGDRILYKITFTGFHSVSSKLITVDINYNMIIHESNKRI